MMASEGLFQCNARKSTDLPIFDAMHLIRLRNKRPGSPTIFKEILKLTQLISQKKISKTGLKV